MQKSKRDKIIFLIIAFILCVCLIIGILLNNYRRTQRENSLTLGACYYKQYVAFDCGDIHNYPPFENDFSLPEEYSYFTYDHIGEFRTSVRLYVYEQNTGDVLTLNEIEVFLSEEFEEDGTPRIFNNGNWPHIESYINWYFDEASLNELAEVANELHNIYFNYVVYYQGSNSIPTLIQDLTPEQLQEVFKKHQDPSYEMNI